MRLRLIAQGSTKRERKALRWGVSFLIGDVLFDAFGRADIFWKNVCKFRVDLSRVRHVVISHEDWDHIAALETFLQKYPRVKVHICEKTGKGLKDLLRARGIRPVLVDGPHKISKNIFLLGQMRADTGRGILYEQALVLRSQKGFSVVAGCAHPGIVQIVKRARKVFGKQLDAICGGFHMKDNTPEENRRIIAKLQALGVKRVLPLHCTGKAACRSFRKIYRRNFIDIREGAVLSL